MSLADYMSLARELQACCLQIGKVKGVQKLARMIGTEIKFFHSLSQKDTDAQTAQLQSSNLSHFAAIVHAVTTLPSVTHVLRPVTSPDRQHSLVVDVVADEGRSWVKVIARKGQALHLVWAGQGQYGERDMVQQMKEYWECARHNQVRFKVPEVHATFYNTVTKPMAEVLRQEGVKVWGQEVAIDPGTSQKLMAVFDDNDSESEYSSYGEREAENVCDFGCDFIDGKVNVSDGGTWVKSCTESDKVIGKRDTAEFDSEKVMDSVSLDDDVISDALTHESTYGPFSETAENLFTKENIPGVCSSELCDPYLSSSETRNHTDRMVFLSGASPVMKTLCSDLESCDLETDSVQVEDICEKPETLTSSTGFAAWNLSSPSKRCLYRILISCPDFSQFGEDCESKDKDREVCRDRVNLDITTLIILVSSVCHGGCNFRFKDKVLDQQAWEERQHPLLPDLMTFLKNKEWVACETAWSDFNRIVQLLGGTKEKQRAEELLKKVTIVDDKMSERASRLQLKGQVKERSKVVFGTGDELEVVTVTANKGFIRAAESQGVSFAVHMLSARALTELKELSATSL